MNKENKIKLGISGGSLKEPIKKLFKMNGYNFEINEAFSTVEIDDSDIEGFYARAKEIAPLISKGVLDAGIVSRTAIAETDANLEEVCDLGTANPVWEETNLVLAVQEESSVKSIKDLQGKKIITRAPEITKKFLKKNGVDALVEFSDGTNESRLPDFADAIVEFTNTGATFRFFGIRTLEILMKDSLVLAANRQTLADPQKKEKIENLGLLLKGARVAQEHSGLMFHASNDMMEAVFKAAPALKRPTVTHLRGENWFDVFVVCKKKEIRRLVPDLKQIGCTDIVEFPLTKVVV